MYLTRVNYIPDKARRDTATAKEVEDLIYEFLALDSDNARLDGIMMHHSNTNNLRKMFADTIKAKHLQKEVEACIRGNTVYLRRIHHG